MPGVNVVTGTLSSGTASTESIWIEPGQAHYAGVVSSLSGSYTLQISSDGSTWYDVEDGTFTADAKGLINSGGAYFRFTSSISSGSVAARIWQGAQPAYGY